MSIKPRVFIASSAKGLDTARLAQEELERDDLLECVVWDQGVFEPGQYALPSLLRQAGESEFGIFVFTPDDKLTTTKKKKTGFSPRDNVVFELGLFTGCLGQDRCFFLIPEGQQETMKIPTDLTGITYVKYRTSERPKPSDLGGACNKLRRKIKNVWQEMQTGWADQRTAELNRTRLYIEDLLEAFARLLESQIPVRGATVRGFCHLLSSDGKTLAFYARYTRDKGEGDIGLDIPLSPPRDGEDWWVISKACRGNCYVCEDVDWDMVKNIHVAGKDRIWPYLKGVICYPVKPLDGSHSPIGVIDFNTCHGVDAVGWNKNTELPSVLALLSDAVYTLVAGTVCNRKMQ